jgi:hypothetical protein
MYEELARDKWVSLRYIFGREHESNNGEKARTSAETGRGYGDCEETGEGVRIGMS